MTQLKIRPSRTEWLSFALLAPFVALWVNYILYGAVALEHDTAWLVSYPLCLLHALACWYLQLLLMHGFRRIFPEKQHFARLSILLFSEIILVIGLLLGLMWAFDALAVLDYNWNGADLRYLGYTGIAIGLVTTTLWETEYTTLRWKEGLAEKEKLEQLAIEQEFESLKGQVNPHFLFNCFNTLSSLITEDKKQAEIFLDELSKVYRYLLKNNEDGLSTLETEISFAASYFKLLQTRHGEAIRMELEIEECSKSSLLPSLSLQLLMENAVKHNVLSRNFPLQIDIFTAGDQLVVSNNLQARTVRGHSNRIGLENIRNKYALLGVSGFQVIRDSKTFSVALPLLKNKPGEGLHYRTLKKEYENINR